MSTIVKLEPISESDPSYGVVITKAPDGSLRYYRLPTETVNELIEWQNFYINGLST